MCCQGRRETVFWGETCGSERRDVFRDDQHAESFQDHWISSNVMGSTSAVKLPGITTWDYIKQRVDTNWFMISIGCAQYYPLCIESILTGETQERTVPEIWMDVDSPEDVFTSCSWFKRPRSPCSHCETLHWKYSSSRLEFRKLFKSGFSESDWQSLHETEKCGCTLKLIQVVSLCEESWLVLPWHHRIYRDTGDLSSPDFQGVTRPTCWSHRPLTTGKHFEVGVVPWHGCP